MPMNQETADLVYPIFRRGLQLLARLRRGEKPDMHAEQRELKRLFRSTNGAGAAAATPSGKDFLGARYPLACWLDELFILDPDSPWRQQWMEETIEWDQFRSTDAAQRFWEQARLAESQSDAGILEVFYLCVVLGFRGSLRGDPARLSAWAETVGSILRRDRPNEWPDRPAELPLPETNVPPLRARERLVWLLMAYAVVIGLGIVGFVAYMLHRGVSLR